MPLADAVVLSSEHPAQEQLDFFNADMATLNRMRTPWVLAMLHRPLFGSDPLDAIDHEARRAGLCGLQSRQYQNLG